MLPSQLWYRRRTIVVNKIHTIHASKDLHNINDPTNVQKNKYPCFHLNSGIDGEPSSSTKFIPYTPAKTCTTSMIQLTSKRTNTHASISTLVSTENHRRQQNSYH